MKYLILLFAVTLCVFEKDLFAQSPIIQWQHSLGGSEWDFANDIQQTSDGGFVVLGTSRSNDGDIMWENGGMDFWVVKLNSASELVWQKTLGSSGNEEATSIQQTSDGGYIVTGEPGTIDGDVSGNNGELGFWIIKLSSTGNIVWENTVGGTDYDRANSIQQTNDGGFIVAGRSKSDDGDVTGHQGNTDFWVVKLDALGNLVWQKTMGGSMQEVAHSIRQTQDGGYVVAGYTSSIDGNISFNHGGEDYWVLKLDNSGNIIWEKTLGGSDYDRANSIQQTSDGGYVIAGFTLSNDGDIQEGFGDIDSWIVKLDSIGNILWEKTLGNANWNVSNSILETNDGRLIVAGETSDNSGFSDAWIVILSSIGDVLSEHLFGGSRDDGAVAIDQTMDGGFVMVGTTESNNGDVLEQKGLSDIWVVKFGEELSIQEHAIGNKTLIMTCNILGQEIIPQNNTLMIQIYSDGSTEKIFYVE